MGARLLDVGEVVIKAPFEEAELRRNGRELIFGGITFHVTALFGEHADRLCDDVSGSGPPSGPSRNASKVGNRARIGLAAAQPFAAEVTAESAARLGLAPGAPVVAAFKATATRLVER